MADVFISYAHDDRRTARLLAEALQDEGLSVWWDEHINAGEAFARKIDEELAGASCCVVLWSAKAARSQWVCNEAAEAASRSILVPVALDQTPLPLPLRHLHVQRLPQRLFTGGSSELTPVVRRVAAVVTGAAVPSDPPRRRVSASRRLPPDLAGITSRVVLTVSNWVKGLWKPAVDGDTLPVSIRIVDGDDHAVVRALDADSPPTTDFDTASLVGLVKARVSQLPRLSVETQDDLNGPHTQDTPTLTMHHGERAEGASATDLVVTLSTGSSALTQTRIDTTHLSSDQLQRQTLREVLNLLERKYFVDRPLTDQARRSFLRIVSASPEVIRLYGEGLRTIARRDVAGNHERAAVLFERAVELDPHCALAWAGLSEVAWVMYRPSGDPGRLRQSEMAAHEALRLDPDQPEVRVALARILGGTGRLAEALEELATAERMKPDWDAPIRLRGDFLLRNGRLEEALQAYRSAVQRNPLHWLNHACLGRALFDMNRFQDATESFRRALSVQPDSAVAHQMLGAAQQAQGNLDGARVSYQRALSLNPTATAYANLASLDFAEGRFCEAAAGYERALAAKPSEPSITYRNLGDALLKCGRTADAMSAYEKGLSIAKRLTGVDGTHWNMLAMQALFEAKLGHCEQARSAIDSAVRGDPNLGLVHHRRAAVYALCGDETAALESVAMAIQLGVPVSRLAGDGDLALIHSSSQFTDLIRSSSAAAPIEPVAAS